MSNAGFFESKVLISASQLLSLHTSPVVLIPGKANCVIDVISLYIRYTPGVTPFNPAANDGFVIYAGSLPTNVLSNRSFASLPAKNFIDQSVNMSMWDVPTLQGVNSGNLTTISVPLSSISGQGVNLYQYNGTSGWPSGNNWTQGNGSLFVFLRYAYLEVN